MCETLSIDLGANCFVLVFINENFLFILFYFIFNDTLVSSYSTRRLRENNFTLKKEKPYSPGEIVLGPGENRNKIIDPKNDNPRK